MRILQFCFCSHNASYFVAIGIYHVEIPSIHYLSAGFAQPAVLLVNTGVYLYKVNARQIYGIALTVYSPV